MDPSDRLTLCELSKGDELDKCESFAKEREVLRMIQDWLSRPLVTPHCDSVDPRLSTMASCASMDSILPVSTSYDMAKSRPPPKPRCKAWKPRPPPKPNYLGQQSGFPGIN